MENKRNEQYDDTLNIFDPHLARILERKRNQSTKYYIWFFTPLLSDFYVINTIDEARALWQEAKGSKRWESWELSKGRELVKKGEF